MAVIYITKEISDFQGDLTSWVLKAFVYVLSCFQLFETPWTVARQTPLSMGILQTGILEWVAMPPPPGDLRNQASNKPRSPTLQADSLPSEPPGKPKNNGVGSLSLLQRIFPIQGANPRLLYCRQILYQLSHQGSLIFKCLLVNEDMRALFLFLITMALLSRVWIDNHLGRISS